MLKKILNKNWTIQQAKKIYFVLIAFLTISYFVFSYIFLFHSKYWLKKNAGSDVFDYKQAKVCIKTHCFDCKIAKTQKQRELWLMFIKKMSLNSWMLFEFPKMWKYSFWMKNTKIPLDIIFINQNFEIVDFTWMNICTWKCISYLSKKFVKYVLEINKGLYNKYNFDLGDKVKIEFLGKK